MVDHDYIRQLISARFDGEVSLLEKDLVDEHLKACESCQKFSQELRRLSATLKKWPDESLSPDLQHKIIQRLTNKRSPAHQQFGKGGVLSEPVSSGRVEGEGNMDNKELVSVGMKSGILTIAIVAIVFLLQVYVNRGLQGGLKMASDDIGDQFSHGNNSADYKIAMSHSKSGGVYSQGKDKAFSGKKEDAYLKARGYGSATAPSTVDQLALSKTDQYEPYYAQTDYQVTKDSVSKVTMEEQSNRARAVAGARVDLYGSVAESVGYEEVKQEESLRRQMIANANMQANTMSSEQKSYYPAAKAIGGTRADQPMAAAAPRQINGSPVVGGGDYSGYADQDYYRYPSYPTAVVNQPVSNTEEYDQISENPFLDPRYEPLSTFSIDVDKASYANVRRFINAGQLPPQDAVRVEELVNYFKYDYRDPLPWEGPFSITTEAARCPWNSNHKLVMIGLQAKRIENNRLPSNNLVFLIDVSGSMEQPNKLPLLKASFKMLVEQLRAEDRVSIVVYAGQAGLVLDATPGNYKERILSAIDQLQAGGSTAGGEGIVLAYRMARQNFIVNGNNRVILATDGDFNVGVSSDDELTRLIEQKRDEGIFLTVLGFGTGNYKDSKMEKLADKGNGNYAYIDNIVEGEKVLVDEMSATLLTVAKDVKIQVEFNPGQVKAYKLVGYENRMLAKEDFNDDRKDAGEIGAGHSVTAFYEIIPAGSGERDYPSNYRPVVDPLKYQVDGGNAYQVSRTKSSNDLMTIKLRYKEPKEDESKLLTKVLVRGEIRSQPKSDNFKFAAAVAEFGLLLRGSQYAQEGSWDHVIQAAQESLGKDTDGYRHEFLNMVKSARFLSQGR